MTSESNDDEERKKTLRIHQYFQKHKSRIGLLVGAALITTVFYIPPHYTEVSCNDPSIRRPYYPDTISVRLLLVAALALPFIMITVLEWVYPPAGISEKDSPLRQSFRRSWRYVGDLFIGGLLMFFFNDLAKIATSEARPSFWSLCSPSLTEEQCLQPYVRISWKDCANPLNFSERKMADSMKSFPSGHSSVSVYSSVFMIAYIQQRVWSNSNRLLVPSLQIMWAVWALICCQSRIWDNKHHWWDVLAGAFLGAFGSFISIKYFSNWFMREEPSEKPGITKRQDYLLQQDEAT